MNNTTSEGTLSARRIWDSAPLVAPMPEHVPAWEIQETPEERAQRIERNRWHAALKGGSHGAA
jgi:hypothetical protein